MAKTRNQEIVENTNTASGGVGSQLSPMQDKLLAQAASSDDEYIGDPVKLPMITRVEVAGPGRLQLQFDDGLKAIVDLSAMLAQGGVFEPLQDIERFKSVEIGPRGRTIFWRLEGEVVDLCADALLQTAHSEDGGTTRRRLPRRAA